MEPISLKEARKKLGDLVSAAERGESVIITRRGKKVARIVSLEKKRRSDLPDLSRFRASVKMKGKPLSRAIVEMRAKERY